MKPPSTLILGLIAALFLRAGDASAQELSLRSAVVPAAPLARAWGGPVLPSAAPILSPALAAPSILLTPSALPAPAAAWPATPAAAAQAQEARPAASAALPASALGFSPAAASAPDRAPAAAARADGIRFWDGSAARRAPDAVEFGEVRRMAEPFRTSKQLAKLARTPRPAGERYRFAVIGDAEPGRFWFWRALFNRDSGVFWRQLAKADRSGADFILQLGDMVSRGVLRNFRAFFNQLSLAAPRTPYLTVIGNHDRHSPHGVSNPRVYRSLFGTTNYAFDRGGRRFVVVDNSAGRITPSQFEWLRSVLSADKPAIVFTHMPPAPLGEWTDFAGRKGAGGFREGAEEFMALMSERKVARVYMGHVHGLGVLERGGVTYVLTGGGGSPLFPGPVKDRFHHFLTVDDGPDGLVETVHRSDGPSYPLR